MFVHHKDERGIAMMMTVVIIFVAMALAALILTQGSNADRHSGRGANWNEALQTADAGIGKAIAQLQEDYGQVPVVQPVVGATADGSYSVTVTALGRGKYRIDSVGTSGEGAGLASSRRIQAIMAPPVSFEYALFSLTDVSTKNNDLVYGDVWANGSVVVELGDVIEGDVVAATGYLDMENNSIIRGDVETGGYNASGVAMDIFRVEGNVTSSSTSPGCVDDPGHGKYKIVNGTVTGSAQSWASSGGISSTVQGTRTPNTCKLAPATKMMPAFTFNPLLYDPAPEMFDSVAAFQTYLATNGNDLEGVFYVAGPGQIDLNGVEISGDTSIIAEQAQVWSNGVGVTNNDDKVFVLASFYQANAVCTDSGSSVESCAIGLKNNFQPDSGTATLAYAPNGAIGFKNNSRFDGAAYGSNIVLKNNMEVHYDARVSQVLGFGPVTLERESWVELPT
jgi:hypothetical protein